MNNNFYKELIVGNYVKIVTDEGKIFNEKILVVSSQSDIVTTINHKGEAYMYWNVKWRGPSCWTCYIDGGDELTWTIIQLPEETGDGDQSR